MGEAQTHEDAPQALDRLADLILFDGSFMERLTDSPHGAREEYGLDALPEEVLDALADISMDEIRVLAQIHQRRPPVVITDNVCLCF